MMDVFSLEEDSGDLFITQSDRIIQNYDGASFDIGMSMEGTQQGSNVKDTSRIYSDISDDDFVDIPCSQKQNSAVGDYQR